MKRHQVNTKHPRYRVPNYPRGQGGGQHNLMGTAVNPPPAPKRDLKVYGMRILGRVPDGFREKQAKEHAEKMAEDNNATIILEKAKYKTKDGRYLRTWRLWHDPYDKDVKVVMMDKWNDPAYKKDRQRRFSEHGIKYQS